MILKDRIRQWLGFRKLSFFVKDKGEWVTAFIELDRRGNGFTFSMVGSYVDGGHYWPSPGKDWRNFLKTISLDYFGTKILTVDFREFDPAGTIVHIKRKLIEWRKDGYMDREHARDFWDALRVREDDLFSEVQVFEWFSRFCVDPYDVTDLIRRAPHQQFTQFYNHLWPKVLAQL